MSGRIALPLLATLLSLAACGRTPAPAQEGVPVAASWPAADHTVVRGPGGSDALAFTTGDCLAVTFQDRADSDDYIHLDLGGAGALAALGEGASLVLTAEATGCQEPVLRLALVVADPAAFWSSRVAVEGQCLLRPGSRTYRFWLDGLQGLRIDPARHRLYLMLQDLGGPAKGGARVCVGAVTAQAASGDWRAAKRACYREQYAWPALPADEALYRQHYQRAVPWGDLAGLPQLRRTDLGGAWRRRDDGERTWDAAYLADLAPAAAAEPPGAWQAVAVPEPDRPDQPAGHRWYRRSFTLAPGQEAGAAWLRCDELAELGHIYLNGTLVGTQTPSYTAFDWYGQNTSRHGKMTGITPKAAAMWRNFDRCGIPFPWERAAIPDAAAHVPLPMQACHHPFPHAWEVGGLLRTGENVLALRIYANPMRGWWVTKTREDRAAENRAGVLAPVTLLQLAQPLLGAPERTPPATCGEDGSAEHRFRVAAGAGVAAVRFAIDGGPATQVAPAGGRAEWSARRPAGFARERLRVAALDAGGRVLDQRELEYGTAVVEVRGTSLLVNGDPFLVRGLNVRMGIEWDNDRSVTRRQAARDLELYRSLGVNALRSEFLQPWELDQALAAGMLVLPTTVAASTDWCWGAFGNLERPDLDLASDRQRNAAVLIARHPAILGWNGANELHHTPGYEDGPLIPALLERIRDGYRRHDPERRPVTFANLDNWGETPWFFTQGQDVVGWNVYRPAAELVRDFASLVAQVRRPVLFTEWGTLKGKPDRAGDKIDGWEADMRAKWQVIRHGEGSAGGFLFPFHGELEDRRGLAFVRELYLPVAVEREGAQVLRLRNRDVCPWRALEVSVLSGDDVLRGGASDRLDPGVALTIDLGRPPPAGQPTTVLVRGTTHRGLVHEHRIPW